MAAVAPQGLRSLPSIDVGSARAPPPGSICAGPELPCGGFLPWDVFLAVGRRLDPPTREIWTRFAFSRARASTALPPPPPACYEAEGHPNGLPEGEALHAGSRTRAASPLHLDHPDGLGDPEIYIIGWIRCGCVCDVNQAQGRTREPPEHDVLGGAGGGAMMDGDGPRVARPFLFGPFVNLPGEILIKIAGMVAKASTRSAAAIKVCCKAWDRAFNVYCPVLVVSRQGAIASPITLLKIVAADAPVGQLRMDAVDCLFPPPVHTICWGSAQGLLALREVASNNVFMHCITCGFRRTLPNLPQNHDPQGIYLRGENFVLAILDDLAQGVDNLGVLVDMSLLYLEQLESDNEFEQFVSDDEAGPLAEGNDAGVEGNNVHGWIWATYPGTQAFYPMRTVNFMRDVTFAAATAYNRLILDTVSRRLDQPFLEIQLAQHLNLDENTLTWLKNGQHLFVCGLAAYLCIFTRSLQDLNEVGVRCFSIQRSEDIGFTLTEVQTVGQYSVYLGSNQPLVLAAIDDLAGRRPNTVYIEDNDGQVRNNRVLAINIGTQEVQAIPFPANVIGEPLNFAAATWAAPFGDNCHVI